MPTLPSRRPFSPPAAALLATSLLALLGACATTPIPEAVPAPREVRPSDTKAAPVALELTELHLRVDEQGHATLRTREVYRVLSSDLPDPWSRVYAFWRPWQDAPPELSATVVAPDGATARLDPSTITDQAEPRSDGLITDGRLRLAPLPRLAIGAVVERTTTTSSKAHLLAAHLNGFALGFPQLDEKKRVIVIDAPASVPLAWDVLGMRLEPRRDERDGRVVLTFERGPWTPPEPPPLYSPGWRVPTFPVLRVSTARSWQDAARAWASRADAQLQPDAVRALTAEVTKGATSRDDKAKAVLAWVRKHVRYTGLELGEMAWVPTKTSDVLQRGYGDCKDLSLLVVAMLRAAGEQADVALVRTQGLDVTEKTPGLELFDHAIVRLDGAPVRWLDPTSPWLALGEVPAVLLERQALVAAASTTRLEPVTSSGHSRLDARVEFNFSDTGAARVRRTRTSDGTLFDDGRALAAKSEDSYRERLAGTGEDTAKSTAKDAAKSAAKGPVKIELSDPFAAGGFRETLDEDAEPGDAKISGESAEARLDYDHGLRVLGLFFSAGKDTERTAPLDVRVSATGRVVNTLRPPPGYSIENEDLVEPKSGTFGPISVSQAFARGKGGELDMTYEFSMKPGLLSADDARALLAFVDTFATTVRFDHDVFKAFKKNEYTKAVKTAEALYQQSKTPRARALVGYALAVASVQDAAEQEARAALAAAGDDLVVRNRVAFVLTHNPHGVEFGRGYPRTELLALTKETVRRFPDNEWARRLHLMAQVTDERGVRLHGITDRAGVIAAMREYREVTELDTFDLDLLELLQREKDWAAVAKHAEAMKQGPQRDAAWFTAELVRQGPEAAMRRAQQGERFTQEVVATAFTTLLVRGEYAALRTFIDHLGKKGDPAKLAGARALVAKLKPCQLTNAEPRWPLVSALALAGANADDKAFDALYDGPPSDHDRRELGEVREMFARAGLGDAVRDLACSSMTTQVTALAGFGELLTTSMDLDGYREPSSVLVRKGPAGYRFVANAEAKLASEALTTRDAKRALELSLALVKLRGKDAPRALTQGHEGARDLLPWWVARLAAGYPSSRAVAQQWLEHHRPEGPGAPERHELRGVALMIAYDDEPAKRVQLARELRKADDATLRRMGLQFEVVGLRDQGAFKEGLAVVDAALKSAPEDAMLLAARVDLLADVGDFVAARAMSTKLAQQRSGREASTFLNNAAWYSIFGVPDRTATEQIERAVELSENTYSLNTMASVYAVRGEWDKATHAHLRHLGVADLSDDTKLHPSYWFVRGKVAEGVGRADAALACYRKVTRSKNKSADDVWGLATARIAALSAKGGAPVAGVRP